jgi:hypothetical protein
MMGLPRRISFSASVIEFSKNWELK